MEYSQFEQTRVTRFFTVPIWVRDIANMPSSFYRGADIDHVEKRERNIIVVTHTVIHRLADTLLMYLVPHHSQLYDTI